MTGFTNYYGRNPFPSDWERTLDFMGYTYLGPVMIPPVPTTVGMVDRNGSGTTWFLMWDGEDHLLLTDQYPMNFPQWSAAGLSEPFPQNTTVFQPYDGPYMGATGARLGVLNGRLQYDFPTAAALGPAGPPIVAPYVLGPQMQSYPEPSNYPAPGVPTIPGIPSSTPPPTGGGYVAFLAAYATNTPPLLTTSQNLGPGLPWYLEYFA